MSTETPQYLTFIHRDGGGVQPWFTDSDAHACEYTDEATALEVAANVQKDYGDEFAGLVPEELTPTRWRLRVTDDDDEPDPNDCAECARQHGPHYRGSCEHALPALRDHLNSVNDDNGWRTLTEKLVAFNNAAQELQSAWANVSDDGNHPIIVSGAYPFSDSFDDLATFIMRWTDRTLALTVAADDASSHAGGVTR